MIGLHEPRFTEDDEQLVLEALRTSWVSSGGPLVEKFEKMFADFVGVKRAVAVVNGTLALQLAIEVLKRQKNLQSDFDIIVPTLSFVATSNAVRSAGGNPVLVDCSPNSMNIDPDGVFQTIQKFYRKNNEGKIVNQESGNQLLCIIPAHIMGWSCNMNRLNEVALTFNLPVIEDAAEALGSRYLDGSHVGTTSLAAVYSFNGNKLLTTGGGGMLTTNNAEFADLAKHLSTTAKVDNLRSLHDQAGYNFRLVNILAALGVSQMKRLDVTLTKKRRIFEAYLEKFNQMNFKVHTEDFNQANHWLVNVRFDSEKEREIALAKLSERKIQARPLWVPAHKLPFFNKSNHLDRTFPNADEIWQTALSLPSSPHLDQNDLNLIVETITRLRS